MLNKNDPLIAAVQKVMQTNQAERDAVRLVNEKFGVTDRRALPRERQHEWDSAYKSILTEGLHPNQQKLDVHEPEKDKLTSQDFKMLRAKKKKPMEEEKKMKGDDPCWDNYEMIGMKKKGGKEVPNCVPVKEQAAGNPENDPYREQQAGSVETIPAKEKSVTPSDQSALKNKIQSIMREAKTNPYAIGMAAVQKSTGDKPPMEKKNITKAHDIAKKIIAKKKMKD